MLARSALQIARSGAMVSRRGFKTSTPRMGSAYHYPEGPRSNLPFDPKKRGFALKFIAFCSVGFGLPFFQAYVQLSRNAE